MIFWVSAGLITLAALCTVWLPLRGKDKPVSVAVASVFIAVVSLGLYLQLGEWQTPESAHEGGFSPEAMVASLANRIKDGSGTVDDYMLLGLSYMQLQRPQDAAEAYAKAMELTRGQNGEVILRYAESRAMFEGFDGGAGALIEQGLNVDPSNPRGLWWGGALAQERGDYALALDRWQRLSDGAPDNIKEMLAPRLVEMSRLAGLEPVTQGTPESAAAAGPEKIQVTVKAPEALTDALNPDTILFVVARSKAGGPPLAVVQKTLRDLPLSVGLSDADAMIPGNTISKHDEVTLSARLALRGTAIRQSGDLLAEMDAAVGSTVELVINQVVP